MNQAGNSSAENDDAVAVWIDETMLRVSIAGAADVGHFIEAISRSVELDGDQNTLCMLLDFTKITELDLSDEDLYRIVAALRRRLRRTSDYRCAVVAPVELLGRLGEEFVRVRDLMAGDGSAVPPVQPFTDLAEAEAWITDESS